VHADSAFVENRATVGLQRCVSTRGNIAAPNSRANHSLSFCGFEMYGGMVIGGEGDSWWKPASAHSQLDLDASAAPDRTRAKTGDGDVEANNLDPSAQAEIELIEEASKLDGNEGVLFNALRASVERTSEVTRESLRERLDHQLSVLSARQRSIEASVEYVRSHLGVEDYDFVFGAGGE
jgi:hypothetical protein